MRKNIGYEFIKELDSYFREIQNIRKLSKKEEQELSVRIKQGDREALNDLVYHNLRFVVNIAKNYRNSNVPFADIISEGNMGLLHAATKFDGDKNIKFISYAVWWIKNSINECIETYNRNTEVINYEDYVIDNCKDVDKELNLVNEDFEEKINNLQGRRDAVDDLLKCLHEREIKILTLFYGLNDGKEMTLDEVGKCMHLTNERVRQIKDTALSKLKCKALTYSDEEIEVFKSLR